MKKLTLRISMLATPMMLVCGLLASGVSAKADPQGGACSNRTISGDFGFAGRGVLIGLPQAPPEVQFRSVGVAHFDGKGNVTWVEHTVVNGALVTPDWAHATGTYSVNSDCTGTMSVTTPNSAAPLSFGLAVVKQGQEVRALLDFSAIESVFIKTDNSNGNSSQH